MPNTPGLFSTRKPWPVWCRICSPMMRMVMSVALPAPNGTITRTGRDGYLSCAAAPPAAVNTSADSNRISRFMSGSLFAGRGPRDSIRLQTGSLGEYALGDDLVAYEGVERGGRHRHRLEIERRQPFAQRRQLQSLHGFLVQALDDCTRRFRRHEHAEPHRIIGVRV